MQVPRSSKRSHVCTKGYINVRRLNTTQQEQEQEQENKRTRTTTLATLVDRAEIQREIQRDMQRDTQRWTEMHRYTGVWIRPTGDTTLKKTRLELYHMLVVWKSVHSTVQTFN
ncbi:uncharacterized protein LOC111073509 [Drosophila obscura]|uniref:uncharacterized protein LOC111073509 n=1 Tax=Drosophila obscura TaxID=7282 RepID=UPI001BB25C89|nr:uncharacterized protein LOC111073509 [Drosophila obscura]